MAAAEKYAAAADVAISVGGGGASKVPGDGAPGKKRRRGGLLLALALLALVVLGATLARWIKSSSSDDPGLLLTSTTAIDPAALLEGGGVRVATLVAAQASAAANATGAAEPAAVISADFVIDETYVVENLSVETFEARREPIECAYAAGISIANCSWVAAEAEALASRRSRQLAQAGEESVRLTFTTTVPIDDVNDPASIAAAQEAAATSATAGDASAAIAGALPEEASVPQRSSLPALVLRTDVIVADEREDVRGAEAVRNIAEEAVRAATAEAANNCTIAGGCLSLACATTTVLESFPAAT